MRLLLFTVLMAFASISQAHTFYNYNPERPYGYARGISIDVDPWCGRYFYVYPYYNPFYEVEVWQSYRAHRHFHHHDPRYHPTEW